MNFICYCINKTGLEHCYGNKRLMNKGLQAVGYALSGGFGGQHGLAWLFMAGQKLGV